MMFRPVVRSQKSEDITPWYLNSQLSFNCAVFQRRRCSFLDGEDTWQPKHQNILLLDYYGFCKYQDIRILASVISRSINLRRESAHVMKKSINEIGGVIIRNIPRHDSPACHTPSNNSRTILGQTDSVVVRFEGALVREKNERGGWLRYGR